MTNLITVLPDLDVAPFSHILPSLERALITTADLLTLDALDVAKRASVPPAEVRRLADVLLATLHQTAAVGRPVQRASERWCGFETAAQVVARSRTISTLDDGLDAALGGGIAAGHVTEIVGESAVGKTQFMLTLLLSAQLSGPESKPSTSSTRPSALYISTEAPLQTSRLSQILSAHPKLTSLKPVHRPSLNRVHSTHVHDVEAQEHILRFQVPVAIQKHNVSLVVIDSIAANYRAEFDKAGPRSGGKTSVEALSRRSAQLAQLGGLLRNLAKQHNVAVVIANQVADRFTNIEPAASLLRLPSQSTQGPSRPGTPGLPQGAGPTIDPPPSSLSLLSTDDPLATDHQQRFFTGWGDDPLMTTNLKTPSLGLTWTNQLATRIALLKEPIYDEMKAYAAGEERDIVGWKRACKVVFSASGATAGTKTAFEIWEGGVRSVENEQQQD